MHESLLPIKTLASNRIIYPHHLLASSLPLISTMSNPKQPNLNGAYYGPPVPPQHTSHSIPRHSSCGPCALILKFLTSIIVILGIAVLAFWLFFRPNHIKVYIPEATLTQFNLTDDTNNNLRYNLSLTTTFRNPNRHIGIYYDLIDARALYDGSRFGYTPIPTFYQDHKSTTSVQSAFSGSAGVLLVGDGVATTYKREKGEGYYYVEVKMYARLRLKVWFVRVRVKPEIDCMLKLPVPGSSNARFEGTKCHIDYI